MAKKNYPRKPNQRDKRAARSFYATQYNPKEKARMKQNCVLLGLNFREVYKDFIENLLNLRGKNLGNHVKDTSLTLGGAFDWQSSPQGFRFWCEISQGERWDKSPAQFFRRNKMGKPVNFYHDAPDGKRYQMVEVANANGCCDRCAFNPQGKFANGKSLTDVCIAVGNVCIEQGSTAVYFKEAVGE